MFAHIVLDVSTEEETLGLWPLVEMAQDIGCGWSGTDWLEMIEKILTAEGPFRFKGCRFRVIGGVNKKTR